MSKRRFATAGRKGRGCDSFAIIADGETEKWYFQLMNQEERLRVHVDYLLPGGNLEALYAAVKGTLENGAYTKVFWIVDFDVITKEEKEYSGNGVRPVQRFSEMRDEFARAFGETLQVAVNNPCLEFWYLLHYEQTGRYYPAYEPDLRKELQKHLSGYEKTEHYYKRQTPNLYARLQPNQAKAFCNAAALPAFDVSDYQCAGAGICQVVEFFLEKKR